MPNYLTTLFILLMVVACNEPEKPIKNQSKLDCSNRLYRNPVMTDVDMSKYDYIRFKEYKKDDNFNTLIKDTTEYINTKGNKRYYEQGNNWTFGFEYAINPKSDYKVYFIGKGQDTITFSLTGMRMEAREHYVGNSCDIVEHVVDGDTIKNIFNLQFFKY